MSLSAGQLALQRSAKQYSQIYLGVLQPATIFACRINDTFATHDMTLEFEYDSVTTGVYTDVLAGQTAFIGSAAGLHDIGICRVRKALGATTFYVGETSEIDFADDLYVTVIDAFDIWPRHPLIIDEEVFMDGDVDYSDQHTDFDPVPIMGGHVVIDVSSYPVAINFPDVANCYVYGSSISTYAFTATAGVVTNGTTTNPTLTISSYPTNGYVRVKLTVTAANGKSFSGYRYVLVYDSSHRPVSDFTIDSCGANAVDGGWNARVTLNDTNDIAIMRERGMAILFSTDYYDGSSDVVGMQAGRENIWMSGWIYQHLDQDDPEFSPNTFDIYSAHFWIARMAAFTTGVEMATNTPAAWTEIGALTVDRGLWHLLHWHSTATQVMDIYLTSDTNYTKECSSPAQNLWDQIVEISGSQLLAQPRCDYNNRLFVKVPYNLIPEGNRAASSTLVMALTTTDYTKKTNVQWTAPSVSQVNLSGIVVNLSGNGSALFSLSEGHTPSYLGNHEILDRLLLSSQSQANSLAGLRFGQQNNPYPEIPLMLHGINRAFDIAPVQYATVALDEFTGSIVPFSIDYSHDHGSGKTEITVTFEAATSEALSINGDIPLGNGDVYEPPRIPPLPPIPSIPPIVPIIPGDDGDVDNGPSTMIMSTDNKGIVYTTNFDESSPEWLLMNGGLEDLSLEFYARKIVACPNGSLYAFIEGGTSQTIWYASGVGDVWVHLDLFNGYPAIALGINPFLDESLAVIAGYVVGFTGYMFLYTGNHNGFTQGGNANMRNNYFGDLIFIENRWIGTGATANAFSNAHLARWSAGGSLEYQEVRPDGIAGSAAFYPLVVSGENEVSEHNSIAGLVQYSDLLGTFTGASDVSDTFGNGSYCSLVSDPTGQFMIGGFGGATAVKRSSDYGRTFGAAPGINVGYHKFANCNSPNAFAAATTQDVRYTPDWGATWANKSGNLSYIAPLCTPLYLGFVSW